MGIRLNSDMYEYKQVGGFRFWCQHVLPLIYDDSLSYYELLCKLFNYMTNFIEDVDNLDSKVTEVIKQMAELKEYVEHYWDDIDVESIVQDKLDQLIADGYFADIIENLVIPQCEVTSIGYFDTGVITHKTQFCNVVKTATKNILIDTGWYTNNESFYQALENAGLGNIDCIIITHYHSDHCANLSNILSRFSHNNCVCYLPPDVVQTVVGDTVYNNMLDVKSALTNNNIPIANNYNDYVVDNNIRIEFYNTIHSSYYASQNFDYNNCCLTPLLKVKNKSVYFASDVAFEAQEYLANVLPPVDCANIAHHGYNEWLSKNYFNRLQAKTMFVSDGNGHVNEEEGSYITFIPYINHISTETWYYQDRGVNIYSTSVAPDYILKFIVTADDIHFLTPPVPTDRITYHYNSFNEIFDTTWKAGDARQKTIYQVLNAMYMNSTVEGFLGRSYFFVPRNIRDKCYMKITKTNNGYVGSSYVDGIYAIVEVLNYSVMANVERQEYIFYKPNGGGWQMGMGNRSMGNFYRYDVHLDAGATGINLGDYTSSMGNDLTQTGTALSTFEALVILTVNGTDINVGCNYGSATINVAGDTSAQKTLARIASINASDVIRLNNNNATNACDVDLLIIPLSYTWNWTRSTLFPTSIE